MAHDQGGRRLVAVVPHTHWDREWYAAFQTFRLALVDLLDDLLPRLEADPGAGHFMLDGQTAVVDDYLALRPEAEPLLRRLASMGRLSMGPWAILMDEFLVSGETIVRDLQMGLARAAAFGGAMEVGYLPDMFGHIAQMPQILAQFGFDDAVVWRGVPAAIDRSAFWWEAPDGSRVRAEYLPEGYGNGAALPADAKDLLAMLDRFAAAHETLLDGSPILWMQGTDHQRPDARLGALVAEANALGDTWHLEVTSLPSYLARAPRSGLPTWQGELRSGARANLLMGVTSNRVDVRRAAAAAERAVERYAEPLSALFLAPDRWPGAALAEAWTLLVRNSAHDSVCACSIDEVCDAVLHRYAEARQIGDGLAARAAAAIAGTAAAGAGGTVVVNPTARARAALVEITIPGHDPVDGTQLRRRFPGDSATDGLTRAMCVTLAREALESWRDITDAEVEVGADGVLVVTVARDPDAPRRPYHGPMPAQVAELAAEDPDGPARFVLRRRPAQRVLVRVPEVPAFGWCTVEPGPLDVEPVTVAEHPSGRTVALRNGEVDVVLDGDADSAGAGTFSIDGVAGLGRLVDDGDAGDTYNWCPPAHDEVVDRPDWVHLEVLDAGPLVARARISAGYRWPDHLDGGHRSGSTAVEVHTTVELRAGEPFVRVQIELDNRCRDHRLRAWFPLPRPADRSSAECAFAVVDRGLVAEGGPTEAALATFPSRRFVQAGGLTVVHDGVAEYELVDLDHPTGNGHAPRARALALTVLRASGWLSQGPMASRPLPAGPRLALEGSQVQGRQVTRLALAVEREGRHVDPFALADLVLVEPVTARVVPGQQGPRSGSALEVRGAEVSAVRREGGRVEVRVVNASATDTEVTIEGRSGWLVDLRGRAVEPFEERFALRAWGIATAVLDEI